MPAASTAPTSRKIVKLVGPTLIELTCSPKKFSFNCEVASPPVRTILRERGPKLYVVAHGGEPVYVGITRQPLISRLRYGWLADGRTGYYGYRWRHQLTEARLLVWQHADDGDDAVHDLETIEAEVVYLVRSRKQWPTFQTEIHFHPSTDAHRLAAKTILKAVKRGS